MLGNNIIKEYLFASVKIIGARNIHVCSLLEAARKGTRMKREAKKKASKKEVVKKVFIPYKKKLQLEKVGTLSPRIDDSKRGYPADDVYYRGHYRWPIFTVKEAIEMHRETQHPTMQNNVTADVIGCIELSMSTQKKNQYVDEFSNVLLLPHQFEVVHERTILAIGKDEEMIETIRKMNVSLSIGLEVIKMAEKGTIDFKSFDYILAHASILPDLIPIRNLLRKKFPSPRIGTAAMNLESLVKKYMEGIKYEVKKDKYDYDYAKIEAKIGTLDMEPDHIEENLKLLINDVEEKKPKNRQERMITKVLLDCGTSKEHFKIDHSLYLPREEQEEEMTLKA